MPQSLKLKRGSNNDDGDSDYEVAKKPKNKKAQAGTSTKKPKCAPPTAAQKNAMLDYMLAHPNYANGRIKGKNAQQKIQLMHASLARILNEPKLKGEPRDGPKWWKCWVSIRNSNKAYASANYQVRDTKTGNGAEVSISSMDQTTNSVDEEIYYTDCDIANKVMKIIGWHNALGMNGVKDELDDTGRVQEDGDNKENVLLDDEEEEDNDNKRKEKEENKKNVVTGEDSDVEMESFMTSSLKTTSTPAQKKDQNSRTSLPTYTSHSVEVLGVNSHQSLSAKTLRSFPSFKSVSPPPLNPAISPNVVEKLDTIIMELKRNSNMMESLLKHLRDDSIMVLTPGSAIEINSPVESQVAEVVQTIPEISQAVPETSTSLEPPPVPEISNSLEPPAVPEISNSQEPPAVSEVSTSQKQVPLFDQISDPHVPHFEFSDEGATAIQEKIEIDLQKLLDSVLNETKFLSGNDMNMPDLS